MEKKVHIYPLFTTKPGGSLVAFWEGSKLFIYLGICSSILVVILNRFVGMFIYIVVNKIVLIVSSSFKKKVRFYLVKLLDRKYSIFV